MKIGWKIKKTTQHLIGNQFAKEKVLGKNNGNWKGNKVSYSGLHKFIARYKPKPKKCDFCQKEKKLELAKKKDIGYSRNLDDWYYLCIKCHRKYDSDIYVKAWKKRRRKHENDSSSQIINGNKSSI